MKIHILTLNFNHKDDTIHCIKSILSSTFQDFHIHVLDNGSSDSSELKDIAKHFKSGPSNPSGPDSKISYYRSDKNLGFAGGNNFLLEKILPKTTEKDLIIFLNNDTEIKPTLLAKIAETATSPDTPMSSSIIVRMTKLPDKTATDNLGLCVHKSGLSKNRKTEQKYPLFGPSGGCATYPAKTLKTIYNATGDYFDPLYFCYAEDTDLAWRALLLGFSTTYINDAICHHRVSATIGGHFNKFIMFHTLRNTLFNITKNMPLPLLLIYSPYILGLQIALCFRYIPTKRAPTLIHAHLSFLLHFPALLKKRRKIQKARKLPAKELRKYFAKGLR
jgi:GT2 family glycosyltransferase